MVLNQPERTIRAQRSTLMACWRARGLLTLDRHNNTAPLKDKLALVSNHLVDRIVLSATDPISLLSDVVQPSSPGHLSIDNFYHLNPSLTLLRSYLRKALEAGREGVNILIYGPPGTGKSQLVKTLAADLGCDLFEVSSEDSDGDPMGGVYRLRAYRAAQASLSRMKALLLFDEVQDVFDSNVRNQPFGSGASNGHKAWINRALEGNPRPSLWLTNSLDNVDGAYIRRFDMALEMSIPPKRLREKIIKNVCGSLLDADAISQLARSEVLAPAVVARASAVVQFVGDDLRTVAPSEAMQHLVNQTLKGKHPVIPPLKTLP